MRRKRAAGGPSPSFFAPQIPAWKAMHKPEAGIHAAIIICFLKHMTIPTFTQENSARQTAWRRTYFLAFGKKSGSP